MSSLLNIEYPVEVPRQREQIFSEMRALLAMQTLSAVRQAIALQTAWLKQYPDDYVMMDAGEVLSKSEAAYQTTETYVEELVTVR